MSTEDYGRPHRPPVGAVIRHDDRKMEKILVSRFETSSMTNPSSSRNSLSDAWDFNGVTCFFFYNHHRHELMRNERDRTSSYPTNLILVIDAFQRIIVTYILCIGWWTNVSSIAATVYIRYRETRHVSHYFILSDLCFLFFSRQLFHINTFIRFGV